eukprot:403341265
MVDHDYSENSYTATGSGISKMYFFGCNIKNPVIINRFSYYNHVAGGMILQPANKKRKDLPLIIQITEYLANSYATYETSIFTVRENAKLYMNGGSINGTFSKKRGSLVLADYQDAYASFFQIKFSNIMGFNGGVFFVHYNSLVEFDQCTFFNSSGIMNGLGTVENNGRFRIMNSVFERIYAIKTSFLAMTDNPLVKSEFINCTFKNDFIITLDFYIDEFVPDAYQSLFKEDLNLVIKRLNHGANFTSKVLRSNLEFDNCVFEDENRLIDIYLSNSNVIFENVKFLNGNYDFQSAARTQFLIQVQLFSKLQLINYVLDPTTSVQFNEPILQNKRAFLAQQSQVLVNGTIFENLQSPFEGGGMKLINSNISIDNITLLNNMAQYGAQYCEYRFYGDLNFTNNFATVMGGGIYTDLYFPIYMRSGDKQVFVNNYAPYGPIIASYPVQVQIQNYDYQTDLVSGQIYIGTIVAELIDAVGFVCTSDSSSTIYVQEIDIYTTKVIGNKQIQVRNGRVDVIKALIHFMLIKVNKIRMQELNVMIALIMQNVKVAMILEFKVDTGGLLSILHKFINVSTVLLVQEDLLISQQRIQCLVDMESLEERGISIVYIKIVVMSLIPLISFIFLMAVQYCIAFMLRKRQHKKIDKDRMILTIIVVFFTLHPSLTKQLFSIFNCMEIDQNQFWLENDLQVECWSPSHTKWAIGAGIPLIFVFVIFLPIYALKQLYKLRDELDQIQNLQKYKMMYQGLKRKVFYWEFINLSFKVILVSINVFLSTTRPIFQIFAGLTICAVLLQVQIQIKPYKNEVFNILEQRSYISVCSVLFGSFFFKIWKFVLPFNSVEQEYGITLKSIMRSPLTSDNIIRQMLDRQKQNQDGNSIRMEDATNVMNQLDVFQTNQRRLSVYQGLKSSMKQDNIKNSRSRKFERNEKIKINNLKYQHRNLYDSIFTDKANMGAQGLNGRIRKIREQGSNTNTNKHHKILKYQESMNQNDIGSTNKNHKVDVSNALAPNAHHYEMDFNSFKTPYIENFGTLGFDNQFQQSELNELRKHVTKNKETKINENHFNRTQILEKKQIQEVQQVNDIFLNKSMIIDNKDIVQTHQENRTEQLKQAVQSKYTVGGKILSNQDLQFMKTRNKETFSNTKVGINKLLGNQRQVVLNSKVSLISYKKGADKRKVKTFCSPQEPIITNLMLDQRQNDQGLSEFYTPVKQKSYQNVKEAFDAPDSNKSPNYQVIEDSSTWKHNQAE